jgi:hypothetical protein
MKKTIIGLSAILVSAFIIIIAVNAQDKPQDNKKATTEVSKDCSKGPNAGGCCKMKYGSTSEAKSCDRSKCKEMAGDQAKCKEGKCTHDGCKRNCVTASGEAKKCDQAKTGSGTE